MMHGQTKIKYTAYLYLQYLMLFLGLYGAWCHVILRPMAYTIL